jgi:hypothetical protein
MFKGGCDYYLQIRNQDMTEIHKTCLQRFKRGANVVAVDTKQKEHWQYGCILLYPPRRLMTYEDIKRDASHMDEDNLAKIKQTIDTYDTAKELVWIFSEDGGTEIQMYIVELSPQPPPVIVVEKPSS